MILVPVKNLQGAKQRLSALLDQERRTALAQAMVHDVLTTLKGWTQRPQVSVVSSDPYACELAADFGFRIIRDDTNGGESDAVEMATAICEAEGVKSTLVIPGDIPLLRLEELERILEAAPERGSVLVPAADFRGTNAALRRPAGLFPLRFGYDSFYRHVAAARATGLPCTVLSLPGIALDIDTPEDLRRLAEAPGERRSQLLVRSWNLQFDGIETGTRNTVRLKGQESPAAASDE